MPSVNPTTPTYLNPDPVPIAVLVNGNMGARYTLDLRTKFGAWLFCRMGRRVSTALNRSGNILVRPTFADGIVNPSTGYNRVSSVAAVAATTLSANASSGATTISLTSATGFAIGDIICMHSPDANAQRVEFGRIANLSGTTVTLDAPLKTGHNNLDTVSNGADVFDRMWLPGGDIWEIRAENFSGYDMLFEVKGETYDSDTAS